MRALFYVHYAVRSLRRDRTRTLLACLCVAFGVLSLVTMQSLTLALLHGSMFDLRLQYGGDAAIYAETPNSPLNSTQLAQIEGWQEQGIIATYTPLAVNWEGFLRTPDSGRVTLLMKSVGFDPTTYPLVGDLHLREPAGKSPAEILLQPTDVLITRDLADSLNLHLGDSFVLSASNFAPARLTVAGIVAATPDQGGKIVLYSLETARWLMKREDVVTSVSVLWGGPAGAEQAVIDSSLRVMVADLSDPGSDPARPVFDLMLKGAGVLGLIVGGIGVSNTLQVVLARRRLEIAMLKTVGFRRANLLLLIGLETGIMGLAGGMVGSAAGVLLTGKLLDVLNGAGTFMLVWTPDPVIILGGVLAGVATAAVFGLQAILVSSATRPVQLLRNIPVKSPVRILIVRAVLYGLLVLIFGALVGLLLRSILEGVALVVGGVIFLSVLRIVFWVVIWAALKLPVPRLPLLRLARSNLRGRKMQASLAVMALFAGTFAVTFAALTIYSSAMRIMQERASDEGYNLLIMTTKEDAVETKAQVMEQGALSSYTGYTIAVTMDGQPVTLEGRSSDDLQVDIQTAVDWQDDADIVLLNAAKWNEKYHPGDAVTVAVNDRTRQLTVTGFYTPTGERNGFTEPTTSVIVPQRIALGLGATQAYLVAHFSTAILDGATTALGEALPDAMVFSKADVNDFFISIYHALFTFAVSVAGLAFLAGAVLIANSAGLTMVERRGEIGVFKAVGYTSRQVLRLLLGEYAFLGLVAGIFGIVGVIIAVMLLNSAQPNMGLIFDPLIAGGMVLFCVLVALVSSALVAWQPARVRPLDVLRYE